MLHKGAWDATLLGTLLGFQDYKKIKSPGRDNSSLAAKGLNKKRKIIFQLSVILDLEITSKSQSFLFFIKHFILHTCIFFACAEVST